MKNINVNFAIIGLILSSCFSPSPTDGTQAGSSDSSPATIERKQEPIETTVLQGKTFYQELAGNGKVTAFCFNAPPPPTCLYSLFRG